MGEHLQYMTPKEIAERLDVGTDAVRMKYRRMFPNRPFDVNESLPSEIYIRLLSDGRRSGKHQVKKSSPITVKDVAEKFNVPPHISSMREDRKQAPPKPAKDWKRRISVESIRAAMLSVILLAVVIGHGALIWYDCATLWGTAGLIGGGVVFLIVLAAVLLAADESRVRTSGTALYFALCIDISAWWVHFPTFQRPDVSDVITGALCAFLCACSWIALFLYRDKNLD